MNYIWYPPTVTKVHSLQRTVNLMDKPHSILICSSVSPMQYGRGEDKTPVHQCTFLCDLSRFGVTPPLKKPSLAIVVYQMVEGHTSHASRTSTCHVPSGSRVGGP